MLAIQDQGTEALIGFAGPRVIEQIRLWKTAADSSGEFDW